MAEPEKRRPPRRRASAQREPVRREPVRRDPRLRDVSGQRPAQRPPARHEPRRAAHRRELSLVDLVDRLLGSGVVVEGHITLSVADVDLVYLNLRLVLSSVETALRHGLPVPGNAALDKTSTRSSALGSPPGSPALAASAHGSAVGSASGSAGGSATSSRARGSAFAGPDDVITTGRPPENRWAPGTDEKPPDRAPPDER